MKHGQEIQYAEMCHHCRYSEYDEPIPHHVIFECVKGEYVTWNDEEECEECDGYVLYDTEDEYWKRYNYEEGRTKDDN